ncbi:hypothetical protein DD238_008333 [Peronospora effusa]|uniref:Uncharacterized protein n=1 Tax=Peronospora effusa TaxID=542832 RepID=A0A3M6VF70_9STRA|nr:hypothetical protein DD238_008333 [Peronospora effusa]
MLTAARSNYPGGEAYMRLHQVAFDYLLTAKETTILEKGYLAHADFNSFAGVEIVDYRITFKTKKVVFLMRNGNRTPGEIFIYPRFRVYERACHAEGKIIQHALTHYQITG